MRSSSWPLHMDFELKKHKSLLKQSSSTEALVITNPSKLSDTHRTSQPKFSVGMDHNNAYYKNQCLSTGADLCLISCISLSAFCSWARPVRTPSNCDWTAVFSIASTEDFLRETRLRICSTFSNWSGLCRTRKVAPTFAARIVVGRIYDLAWCLVLMEQYAQIRVLVTCNLTMTQTAMKTDLLVLWSHL